MAPMDSQTGPHSIADTSSANPKTCRTCHAHCNQKTMRSGTENLHNKWPNKSMLRTKDIIHITGVKYLGKVMV